MGRPRGFDRDHALDLAVDAFWANGYAATSIALLTDAMGIAAPSMYAAFGDKQALFTEAVARYAGRMHAGLEAALAEPTAHAAVTRVLRDTADAHTDPGRAPGCLVMSEPLLAEERDRVRDALAERLRRGVTDGDLAEDVDATALAALVCAVLVGMSAQARDGAGRETLQAVVDQALKAWPVDPARAAGIGRGRPG